jgi:hypothetical protein
LKRIAGVDPSNTFEHPAMNNHHYSALDRHAVLVGGNDSFPWFASQMLALEASHAGRQRMEKFACGDSEPRSTMSKKFFAAVETGMRWFAIASAS